MAANNELATAVDDEFMERIVDATAPVKACIVGADVGAQFILLHHEREEHRTPFGTSQNFVYSYCLKGVR